MTAEELQRFVARRLPDPMVPSCVVSCAELPLAADGTVDLGALPDPAAEPADGGHRQGRTPQEESLCELVADVLGVDQVGIDDDLFALGCNSLKATRIIGRMRRTLGLEDSIRVLFQHSRIAELSEHLKPATAKKTRPSLGTSLRRVIDRDTEGPGALARHVRTETKEQVLIMRDQVKKQALEQAQELKDQLTASTRQEWDKDEFQAQLIEDVNDRIRSGIQRSLDRRNR